MRINEKAVWPISGSLIAALVLWLAGVDIPTERGSDMMMYLWVMFLGGFIGLIFGEVVK